MTTTVTEDLAEVLPAYAPLLIAPVLFGAEGALAAAALTVVVFTLSVVGHLRNRD